MRPGTERPDDRASVAVELLGKHSGTPLSRKPMWKLRGPPRSNGARAESSAENRGELLGMRSVAVTEGESNEPVKKPFRAEDEASEELDHGARWYQEMKSQPKAAGKAASKLISERIAELGDWRGDALARMRALIREADPDVVEEWKWMGTPVWSHDGGICTGESYKSIVKLTFFKGASLKDPAKLFNSSLDGNVRRAIDIHEGEEIDANAFKALIRAAVALNTSGGKKSTKRK